MLPYLQRGGGKKTGREGRRKKIDMGKGRINGGRWNIARRKWVKEKCVKRGRGWKSGDGEWERRWIEETGGKQVRTTQHKSGRKVGGRDAG